MATVYLAIQQSLDRKIALKIMSPSLAADKDFCKRFSNEGKIIAQLSNHPDIVSIYDIGCVDGTMYYMAMEYVSGGCLTDILDERVDPGVAVNIVRRMSGALGCAHDHGFVHRDVKPANILFHDDGSPTLTDFGIAKSLSGDTQLTKDGYAVGTPDYMSPEQAKGGDLDGRSDLYSLGVVFYEMLAGRRPFQGEDHMSVILMHLNDPAPPLPGRVARYQQIIDKLLSKKPEDRFANTRDLLKALDALAQKSEYPVSDVDPSIPTAQTKINPEVVATGQASPPARGGGTHSNKRFIRLPLWGQIASLALLSMLAATTVIWYINGSDRPPDGKTGGPIPITGPIIPEDHRIPPAVQERINVLLKVAAAHMSIGRYREPMGANAYEAYQLVLSLDPENAVARQGIAEIDRLTNSN